MSWCLSAKSQSHLHNNWSQLLTVIIKHATANDQNASNSTANALQTTDIVEKLALAPAALTESTTKKKDFMQKSQFLCVIPLLSGQKLKHL